MTKSIANQSITLEIEKLIPENKNAYAVKIWGGGSCRHCRNPPLRRESGVAKSVCLMNYLFCQLFLKHIFLLFKISPYPKLAHTHLHTNCAIQLIRILILYWWCWLNVVVIVIIIEYLYPSSNHKRKMFFFLLWISPRLNSRDGQHLFILYPHMMGTSLEEYKL